MEGSQLDVRQPSWASKRKDRTPGKLSAWAGQLAPTPRNTGKQEHRSSHILASNVGSFQQTDDFYKASTYSSKGTTPEHSKSSGFMGSGQEKSSHILLTVKKQLHGPETKHGLVGGY